MSKDVPLGFEPLFHVQSYLVRDFSVRFIHTIGPTRSFDYSKLCCVKNGVKFAGEDVAVCCSAILSFDLISLSYIHIGTRATPASHGPGLWLGFVQHRDSGRLNRVDERGRISKGAGRSGGADGWRRRRAVSCATTDYIRSKPPCDSADRRRVRAGDEGREGIHHARRPAPHFPWHAAVPRRVAAAMIRQRRAGARALHRLQERTP